MVKDLVGAFFDFIKLMVFYLVCTSSSSRPLVINVLTCMGVVQVRLCGSPNHTINSYKAAVSAVHISLVSLAFIPTTLSTFKHVKVTSLPSSTVLDDSLITNNLYANGIESVERAKDAEEKGVLPPLNFRSQADWKGRERVGVMTVLEWEAHEKEAEFLVEKCESLYQTFFKLEAGGVATKVNGNGKA